MAYLFSQFSSLETGVLFSPLVALADEWTFMIWLAIICKQNQSTVDLKTIACVKYISSWSAKLVHKWQTHKSRGDLHFAKY
jgi:hypothetical protein